MWSAYVALYSIEVVVVDKPTVTAHAVMRHYCLQNKDEEL